MNREDKVEKQIELQYTMQKAGVNLVTCGHCGSTLLHAIPKVGFTEEVECYICDFKSDPCDFPDYFYDGMPMGEFEDTKTVYHNKTFFINGEEELEKFREAIGKRGRNITMGYVYGDYVNDKQCNIGYVYYNPNSCSFYLSKTLRSGYELIESMDKFVR